MLLSPFTLMVWPLSVASVQLPPDCFRQPRIVVCCPLLEFAVVAAVPCELGFCWLFWSGFCCASLAAPVAVDPVGLAALPAGPVDPAVPWLPPLWPAPAPLPACANAMPEASTNAIKSFLFIVCSFEVSLPVGLVERSHRNVCDS